MCDTCVAMLVSYVEERRRRNKLSRWVALGQGGPLFITTQTAISFSPSLMMGSGETPAAFQTEWMGFNKFKIICTFASNIFKSNVCFQTLQWYENQTWSGRKCHLYHTGKEQMSLFPLFRPTEGAPAKVVTKRNEMNLKSPLQETAFVFEGRREIRRRQFWTKKNPFYFF